jgi:hypothetical protein
LISGYLIRVRDVLSVRDVGYAISGQTDYGESPLISEAVYLALFNTYDTV